MASPPDTPADTLPVKFVCTTERFSDPHSGGPKKLAVVGGLAELGGWSLAGSLPLEQTRQEGEARGEGRGGGGARREEWRKKK
jgi:hypothetical protein